MARILKVLPNEKIEIKEYRPANAVFNTNEYTPLEEFCVLSEVIDPFKMLYENQQLQNNWNELKKWLEEQYKLNDLIYYNDIDIVNPKKARIEYISKREELKEILDKMQELEGNNE